MVHLMMLLLVIISSYLIAVGIANVVHPMLETANLGVNMHYFVDGIGLTTAVRFLSLSNTIVHLHNICNRCIFVYMTQVQPGVVVPPTA